MLSCPFCGAAETARFDLEGHRFLVFGCSFTPEVDPQLSEAELVRHLANDFGRDGSGYFRQMCDRLHLYVTKGDGARHLRDPGGEGSDGT
ncbi:MAG TPA: hypothetical protein VEH57_06945 [Thermoplasmata archaeon]|nr:hypothetical protein [Thermoplasmata archaeon]